MHDPVHLQTVNGRGMYLKSSIVAVEEVTPGSGIAAKCRIFVNSFDAQVGWIELATPYDVVVAAVTA